jgi:hypothetical protein
MKGALKMGYAQDHEKCVVNRWAKKFKSSGMPAMKFKALMKKTLVRYGWTETEAERMTDKAIKAV